MKIILKWLTITHQFWLATSAVGGACIAVFYWWLFGINPFHDGSDAKERNDLVTYYCDVALRHIDKGNYDQATSEYERAIALSSNHVRASVGLALCGLVIDERKVDWTPTVGTAVIGALESSDLRSLDEFAHVIWKYKGDVAARLGRDSLAISYYNNAIAARAAYNDALYALGWMEYFGDSCRIEVMNKSFSAMLANDSTDSRAYNGIAYSHYMSAVKSANADDLIRDLMTASRLYEEARLITSASDFNVLYGAAEVAMLSDPVASIWLYSEAIRCITDSTMNVLYMNSQPSSTRLLMSQSDSGGTITMRTSREKLAAMHYGMSLDALVLSVTDVSKTKYWRELQNGWLNMALRLDPTRKILHIHDSYTYICAHVYSMYEPRWGALFSEYRKRVHVASVKMTPIPINVLQDIGAITGS